MRAIIPFAPPSVVTAGKAETDADLMSVAHSDGSTSTYMSLDYSCARN